MVKSVVLCLFIAALVGACLVEPANTGTSIQPDICVPPVPSDGPRPVAYQEVLFDPIVGYGPECYAINYEWSNNRDRFRWIDPQHEVQQRECTSQHRFTVQPAGALCRVERAREHSVFDIKTDASYPIVLKRARVSLCYLAIELANAASFADVEVWLVDARVGVQERGFESILDDPIRVPLVERGQSRGQCEHPLRVVEIDDFSSGFAVTLEMALSDWPRLQARPLGTALVRQWMVEELSE